MEVQLDLWHSAQSRMLFSDRRVCARVHKCLCRTLHWHGTWGDGRLAWSSHLTKIIQTVCQYAGSSLSLLPPFCLAGPVGIVKQGEDLVAAEGLLGIFIFFVTWQCCFLELSAVRLLHWSAWEAGT